MLRVRCEAGVGRRYGNAPRQRIWKRLDDELQVVGGLGFASYFLTVADVCGMVRDLGIRSAARGSGAGSLVNYLLGVSGIDPLRHGLLMERFLSPRRRRCPTSTSTWSPTGVWRSTTPSSTATAGSAASRSR